MCEGAGSAAGIGKSVEELVEDFAEPGGVGDDVAELGEPLCIWRLGEEELEVAGGTVFLVEVGECALPVLVGGERGVVVESELDGALNDLEGVDVAVGLGNDASVDGLRRLGRGGAVVGGGLSHDLELCWLEPLEQTVVGQKYAGGIEVMALAAVDESEVVVGGDGVDHVDVDVVVACEVEAVGDDGKGVVAAVCGVEVVVAGEDVRFDIVDEGLAEGGGGE